MNTRTTAEFDQYARDYLHKLSHPLRNLIDPEGHYFIELKSKILENLAREHYPNQPDIRIADVGTGLGLFEKYLQPIFKNIAALDLSFEMLQVAKTINPLESASSGYVQGDAFRLPLDNDSADLVFMSCVLHHLEDAEIMAAVQELTRVCAPGGIIVFFEHNPLNPFTQLVVKTTPLDQSARLVSCKNLERTVKNLGLQILHKEFFLYGTRGVDQFVQKFFPWLKRTPIGGQYALVGSKKA